MRGRSRRTPPLGSEVRLSDSPVRWRSRWGHLPLSDTRVEHPDPNLEQTNKQVSHQVPQFHFFHNNL